MIFLTSFVHVHHQWHTFFALPFPPPRVLCSARRTPLLAYTPSHQISLYNSDKSCISFPPTKRFCFFFPIHSLLAVLPLILLLFFPYSPLPLFVSHHHRLHHSLLQSNFLKFPCFSRCGVRRGGSAFTQCAGVDAT